MVYASIHVYKKKVYAYGWQVYSEKTANLPLEPSSAVAMIC